MSCHVMSCHVMTRHGFRFPLCHVWDPLRKRIRYKTKMCSQLVPSLAPATNEMPSTKFRSLKIEYLRSNSMALLFTKKYIFINQVNNARAHSTWHLHKVMSCRFDGKYASRWNTRARKRMESDSGPQGVLSVVLIAPRCLQGSKTAPQGDTMEAPSQPNSFGHQESQHLTRKAH